MPSFSLPTSMKALVLEDVGNSLKLKTVPTPQPGPGSAVVKILATLPFPNASKIFSGELFTFPTPFVPGTRCIGRVAAAGPDATSLKTEQLVLVDPWIRGRDNTDVQFILGAFDGPVPESKKLCAETWRDGCLAEYVKAPLENVWALDEKKLCGSRSEGGLGYTIAELCHIMIAVLPYAGLREINLQAGETVIISPATGVCSGAGVGVAVAMGASVIAVSRNFEMLKKVQATYPSINIVQHTGDVEKDIAAISKFKPADAYLDFSPAEANGSTHVRSCLMALKQYARASLMGVINNDIAIPYMVSVFKNLTIRGQYMYEREHVKGIIKMAESGVLKLGKEAGQEVVAECKFEDFEKAFHLAETNVQVGKMVVITP